jgi:hypothetical protein
MFVEKEAVHLMDASIRVYLAQLDHCGLNAPRCVSLLPGPLKAQGISDFFEFCKSVGMSKVSSDHDEIGLVHDPISIQVNYFLQFADNLSVSHVWCPQPPNVRLHDLQWSLHITNM